MCYHAHETEYSMILWCRDTGWLRFLQTESFITPQTEMNDGVHYRLYMACISVFTPKTCLTLANIGISKLFNRVSNASVVAIFPWYALQGATHAVSTKSIRLCPFIEPSMCNWYLSLGTFVKEFKDNKWIPHKSYKKLQIRVRAYPYNLVISIKCTIKPLIKVTP